MARGTEGLLSPHHRALASDALAVVPEDIGTALEN
jgi:hypothetical protein